MRLGIRTTLVLALLAAPAPLAAQRDTVPADTLPAYVLQGVTVTSTRAPAARLDVPQKIDVVTRADLDRTVGDDVGEALKETLGLDIIQYPALLSGVSVRGFRPQFSGLNARTLILLDGRPAGATNLATLDLSSVERIEVLRGPASALYGSNAMGGTVNIVTRRSRGPVGGSVSGAYGSFDSWRGELVAGGSVTPALSFDLALATAGRAAGYEIGGSRLLGADSVTKTLPDGGTMRVPEVALDSTLSFAEYATRSGSLRLGYALGERWEVEARGGVFVGDEVQNPGDLLAAYDGRTLNDLERRTGELGVRGELGAHRVRLRAFASHEETAYWDDALNPSFVNYRAPLRWHGAQLQDVVALGGHTLTAGLDYTAAEASSAVFAAPGERAAPYSPDYGIYSAAAFAQARLGLLDDRLVATLGGRMDRVTFRVRETELLPGHDAGEETHAVFNPSAGVQYRLPGGVRLHASGGRAFVTPESFNVAGYAELAAGERAVTVTRGNPELDPESSVGWDAGVGISRPQAGLEADLTWFRTDARDRITTTQVPVDGVQLTAGGDTIRSITTYVNADRAEIRGLEGRLSYDLGALSGYRYSLRLFASGTRLLRAEETTGGETRPIRNVADLTLVSGIDFDDLDRLGARLSARYVGERVDTDFSDWMNPGDVRYPRFLVLDLAARVRLADRYRLGLLVDNLTDENYYEVRGYNLPGRSVMVQVGVEF